MRLRSLLVLLSLLFCLHCSAAAEPKQNVLFLISDDLKASVLGCYGDKLGKSPHLDKLAAAGMIFERAYCQGLACAPSRRSFMFSRYLDDKPPADHPSVAEHFKNNGYNSTRVGKIYHMRVPGDIIAGTDGVDHAASWTQKFNCQGDEAHTPGLYSLYNKNIVTRAPENRQSTRDPHRMFVSVVSDGDGSEQPDHKAATKANELLAGFKQSDTPFFLAVGFVRPHYPMVQPKMYFDPFPIDKIPLPEVAENDHADIPGPGISRSNSKNVGIDQFPDNIKGMWSAYYASVMFMDEQVGRVLEQLDALGLRESTTVVFTSDHGYHLGEHHMWQKSNLHEEVTRVPLIIDAPGKKPGRSSAVCELVDLYPTFTELAGLPLPAAVQGQSLVPVLDDPAAVIKSGAISGGGKNLSFRSPDWAYMRYGKDGKGGEELYDMNADPQQFTNLASVNTANKQLQKMRAKLTKALAR